MQKLEVMNDYKKAVSSEYGSQLEYEFIADAAACSSLHKAQIEGNLSTEMIVGQKISLQVTELLAVLSCWKSARQVSLRV